MLRKTILLFFLLFSSFAVMTAQEGDEPERKVKADKLYDIYSFEASLKKYESLKNKTPDILRKLAEGYLKIRDFKKSEKYYEELVKSPNKQALDVYNYAYVLAMNEKYTQYADQMNIYYTMKKDDKRAVLFKEDYAFYEDLLIDKKVFEVKELDFNSSKQDFGTSYFKDKIVFASSGREVPMIKRLWTWNQKPFLDIYVADIDSGGHQLSHIKKFRGKNFNQKYHDGPACFNKEGTLMAFTRNNYEVAKKNSQRIVKLEIFFSEWKDNKWSIPTPFSFNDPTYSVGHPSLSADGRTMYFASDMPGGYGGVDLYVTHKSDSGGWSRPKNLGKQINTEGNEMFPFISENGVLFFASNGLPGLGGLDIFFTKETMKGDYRKPKNAGIPVNGSKDDFAMIISFKDKTGYFSSGRESGKGNDDIYAFRLLKDLGINARLTGKVVDDSDNLIAGATVQLFDDAGKLISEVITGEDGAFSFEVDPEMSLRLDGNKEKYFGDSKDVGKVEGEKNVTLLLRRQPDYKLICNAVDAKTGEAISEVIVAITDNKNSNQSELIGDAMGAVDYDLSEYKYKDSIDFSFVLNKKGYLTETMAFQKTLDNDGVQRVTVKMNKMEVGLDLGKMLKLKEIYFDLAKWNIRPDAAVELDKIVAIMNEYPNMYVKLSSHTDCRGSARFNMRLSDKRAKSSADYINKRISGRRRIFGKGYGESRLVNDCACEGKRGKGRGCTEEQHQENRRTEFKILKM